MHQDDKISSRGELSNAERQARYRARRLAAEGSTVVRYRKVANRRSRSQRWHDAVAELLALQTEYAVWLDGLPASLHGGATAEALQAVADLDLEAVAAVEPPRGYGRD